LRVRIIIVVQIGIAVILIIPFPLRVTKRTDSLFVSMLMVVYLI
jgi:hypothetical protein